MFRRFNVHASHFSFYMSISVSVHFSGGFLPAIILSVDPVRLRSANPTKSQM